MNHLFSPIHLRDITLPNRIVVSPMCQYSAQDGLPDNWHFVNLGGRAVGGAGLTFFEATAVTAEGRITLGDLGIWSDQHIESFAHITKFIHQQGSVAGIQLAHAGRKGSTYEPWNNRGEGIDLADGGWTPVGPSAVPFSDRYPMPAELSQQGIREITQAFVEATKRAFDAGIRLIEVHAAHGYLFTEFLSPLSNKRTDKYGGSFENRTRFLLETVRAVRDSWPERLPMFVRISASEWIDGGWTIEDSVALARKLKELEVDLIDCSSGGNVPDAKIPVGPGYQTAFAEQIRREAGIATGAVGMITDPAQADQIVRTGQADVVLLARELLRDPYWPLRAAAALGHETPWPKQYARAAAGKVPHRTPIQLPEVEYNRELAGAHESSK